VDADGTGPGDAALGPRGTWPGSRRPRAIAPPRSTRCARGAPATELAEYPAGAAAGSFACSQAEVLALLGDDARMLPALRRCLTLPGGYEPHYVRAEPAFADVRDDPRVRALVAEAVARRRAPVRRAG
jgi:hypothetical protein